MFPADFVVRGMKLGIFSGSAPFSPSDTFRSSLRLSLLCRLTVASGPDVRFGMAGCLGSLGCFLWEPSLL